MLMPSVHTLKKELYRLVNKKHYTIYNKQNHAIPAFVSIA